jgi:hypothetical protein
MHQNGRMSDQSSNGSADEKTPVETAVEHAVEALVYAPIGLLFEGASLLPQLVEKGKAQVTMARMLGKFAVEQGRGEATKAAGRLQDQAAGLLDFIGGTVTPLPAEPPAPEAAKATAKKAAKATPARGSKATAGAARQAARKVAGVVDGAAPDVTALAIPDYDGLSASHVVNRLASLSAAELEAVRSYEAGNRGRKTILSKIAQLQSS